MSLYDQPPIQPDRLLTAIKEQFATETRRIVEEEAVAAGKRTEERVRAMAGQIAAKVATWMEVRTNTENLVITLRIPNQDPRHGD